MEFFENLLNSTFSQAWHVLLFIPAVLLLFSEVGYLMGKHRQDAKDKSHVSDVQSAILGLMGLLLGFSFAMGVSRYDTRRSLVVQESNTIGTTWLRANFLPPEHRDPVKKLLREYVDVRLRLQGSFAGDSLGAAEIQRSAEIETALWAHTTDAAIKAPHAITNSFVTTMNEMIDTDAERVAALRNRIPGGVWLMLVIVAAFGCFTTGYSSGFRGARSAFTSLAFPVLVTVVMLLIYDLMHPHSGLVGISQQPLLDLRNTMDAAAP